MSNLPLPVVGGSNNTWGTTLNAYFGQMYPLQGIVADGVTDNYTVIMNGLANNGSILLPTRLGQIGVSKPILLDSQQGIFGNDPLSPSTGTLNSGAVVPLSGFNATLTGAQQSHYPGIGTTASAPIVYAGDSSYTISVLVSGLGITASAAIVNGTSCAALGTGFLGGTTTTFLDNGVGNGQFLMNACTLRGSGSTTTAVIDIESFDWVVANCRITGGSKIFNAGGIQCANGHFTGVSSGQTFNTKITAPGAFSNIYFDGGSTDCVLYSNSNTFNASLTGCRFVNNGGGDVTNMIRNTSSTSGVTLIGGECGNSTHNFTHLWTGANSFDYLDGFNAPSSMFTTPTLTGLFTNGPPGYMGALMLSGKQLSGNPAGSWNFVNRSGTPFTTLPGDWNVCVPPSVGAVGNLPASPMDGQPPVRIEIFTITSAHTYIIKTTDSSTITFNGSAVVGSTGITLGTAQTIFEFVWDATNTTWRAQQLQ